MELMDYNEFIHTLKDHLPKVGQPLAEEDRFGIFPITNRGIQIWLPLSPCDGSRSVFKALLPCRRGPSGLPVAINLVLWKSDYYRHFSQDRFFTEQNLQFRQVFLRCQDMRYRDVTFEIDDHAITENGFTECNEYPSVLSGTTRILTSVNPFCVKVYCHPQANRRFAVGFGQCFGQDWIHCIINANHAIPQQHYAREVYNEMLVNVSEYARSLAKARPGRESFGCVWIKHTCPQSTWTVRTSCIVWGSSRITKVMLEVLEYPGLRNGSDEWRSFDIEVGGFSLVYAHGTNICRK